MWPMLLDYTKDESKRILRRLELEAYASIISVFRAHGDLSKEKKSILQELQQTLSISTERHRAEVRRAINDEKLATIAENISGSMVAEEWQVEGRRLVPLMPRLVPQTAFTSTANQAASAMMEKNASLPPPASTWNRDGPMTVLPKTTRSSSPSSNVVVLPSGTSIHIKGMLNQDEEEDLGNLAAAATAVTGRRASQRSLSTDSQNAASSVSTQTPRVTYTTASNTAQGTSPVKITISKSPQSRPISVQSSSQPPKVILVTSAGPAPASVQRSMSVPLMRSTQPIPLSQAFPAGLPNASSAGGVLASGHMATPSYLPPRSSVMVPGSTQMSSSAAGPGLVGQHQHMISAYSAGVVTTSSGSSLVSTTVTMPISSLSNNPALFSPSHQMAPGKIRPRIVPRQRYPAMVPQNKPGVVLPSGPQLMSPMPHTVSLSGPASVPSGVSGHHLMSTAPGTGPNPVHHHQHLGAHHSSTGIRAPQPAQPSLGTGLASAAVGTSGGSSVAATQHAHLGTGVQVKTFTKPTIQIKQEGGMKIITQGGSSKILPKPTQAGGPPVVMVNTGQGGTPGSTTGITMLPRSISTYTAHSGGKVLNITTPGGRVIATTTKATNVVNPKTLHLTAVKSGSVSKPNVIVVQKTQHARFQNPLGGNIRTVTTSTLPGAIDKELMGLVHHKDAHGRHILTGPVVSTTTGGTRPGERRVIITTSGGGGEPVSIIHRGRADSEGKTSLLAELIQAAGIMPSDASVETVAQGTDPYDFDNLEGAEQRGSQHQQVVSGSSGQVIFRQGQSLPPGAPAGSFHRRPSQQQQTDSGKTDWLAGPLHEDKNSSQDSDSGTEQVFTLEQAMSLLNKEEIDLCEPDPPTAGTAVPSTPLPLPTAFSGPLEQAQVSVFSTASVSSNTLNPSLTSQSPSQPRVSILAKSKLLSGVVKDPPAAPSAPASTAATPISVPPSEVSTNPEEGLKEGQLDTQTGLFYQVGSPPTIKVGLPSHLASMSVARTTVTSSLSNSQPLVIGTTTAVSLSTAAATKLITSLPSPAPLVSQASQAHRTTLASVTTTSPLTVLSARLPPATLLTSSTAPLSSSTSHLPPQPSQSPPLLPVSMSAKPTHLQLPQPSLDLVSSSLAQAQINLQDQDTEEADYEAMVHVATAADSNTTKDAIDNVKTNAGDDFIEEEEDDDDDYDEDYDDVVEECEGDGASSVEAATAETPSLYQSTLGAAERESSAVATQQTSSRSGLAEVLREETAKDGTLILTVSNPASSQPDICVSVSSALPVPDTATTSASPSPPTLSTSLSSSSSHHVGPTLVSLPSQLSRIPVSPLPTQPSQTAVDASQFFSMIESQPVSRPSSANTSVPPVLLPASSNVTGTLRPLPVATSPGQKAAPQLGVLPIAVSVEPAGPVIALNLDDLSSQQVVLAQGEPGTSIAPHDDLITGGSDVDSQADSLLVRSSKRKRKHNSGYDEPSSTNSISWVKSASNLLFKVARFKGSPRDKTEIPAAEWFTFPVDPTDAPDYYTVVENPMDFSTMRKKLETGQYNNFEEFHCDMDLIRNNCYLYNSEGTKVRRDCDEVMAFYQAELLKMQGKQAFTQLSSPLKKPKDEKIPQKQ